MNNTSAKPNTLLVDDVIETSKGNLVVKIDFANIQADVERYKDRFMLARGIPFSYMNLSAAADPLVILASQQMQWTENNDEIIHAVRQHYARLEAQANNDAAIIAMTLATPDMNWEPEPYEEKPMNSRSWDVNLPDPVINLRHPLERRLKQIIDMISSDASVGMRFGALLESIFIEAERRSRSIEAVSGFQSGSVNGPVLAEVESASKKRKA